MVMIFMITDGKGEHEGGKRLSAVPFVGGLSYKNLVEFTIKVYKDHIVPYK